MIHARSINWTLVLGIVAVALLVAGVWTNVSVRTDNESLRDIADRFETEAIEARSEAADLKDSLGRANDQLRASQAALDDAAERARRVEAVAGELAGVIDELTGGAGPIGDLIRDIADEVGQLIDDL